MQTPVLGLSGAPGAPRAPFLRRPASLALAAALVAASLAGCRSTDDQRQVSQLIDRAEYRAALELARERQAADPGSDAAQRDLERAEVAYLLDLAREANFAGDFEHSLALLDQALAILPGQAQVEQWRTKNLRQLAAQHRDEARLLEATGEFDAAYLAFLESTHLDPEEPAGTIGAERVLLRANYREGLGDAYYRQGVRALRDFRAAEAVQDLSSANKYVEGDPRYEDRNREARSFLAEERIRIGEELEAQGLYRAARNEYRIALLVLPDAPQALAGIERCTQEVQVLDFLNEADRELRRNDFEQARVRVERAERLTQHQAELVAAKAAAVEQARLEHLYEEARALESDYDFPAAIAAYAHLLDQTEGYYEDAIARRETLEGYVELAADLYSKANLADGLDEQRALLRRIDLFWPTYRDVRQRLSELEVDTQ
jgi:tetratricopeptide (TPR) repeat protein